MDLADSTSCSRRPKPEWMPNVKTFGMMENADLQVAKAASCGGNAGQYVL